MSGFKILKLKSGESIITKIIGKKDGKLTLENPMLMNVSSLSDPFSGLRKEILTLRNWLEYSDTNKVAVPIDWIALFLDPDKQASKLYETEMKQSEVDIEQLLKDKEEEIRKFNQDALSQIMMSFAIDEDMFKKLVEEGILEDMEDGMELDSLDGSHDDLEIQGPPRSGDEVDQGNHWRDWSSDLRDYL